KNTGRRIRCKHRLDAHASEGGVRPRARPGDELSRQGGGGPRLCSPGSVASGASRHGRRGTPARFPLHACGPRAMLNRMVKYSQPRLDASFAALSDATRRGVLEQLGRSDASITDLAEKFHMTLPGMMKHVGVLEQAELVTTEKVGRVRTCKLGTRRL